MDWLTFISNIVSSTSWPFFFIVLSLILRPVFNDLLVLLRRIKWGDLEAEFGRDLQQIREIADESAISIQSKLTGNDVADLSGEFLLRLADLSPRSVILESWRDLEAVAVESLRQRESESTPRVLTAAAIGKRLLDAGVLDDASFQIFTILRNLRNRAAHETGFTLGKEDAVEFAIMAKGLENTLKHGMDAPTEEQKL